MSITRRAFCGMLAAAAAGCRLRREPQIEEAGTDAVPAGRGRIRTIAYNVLKCTGWPPEAAGAQDARRNGEMPRLFAEALHAHDPDIITFAEAPWDLHLAPIVRRLRMFRVTFNEDGSWPGALLTRHQVVQSRNCPVVGGRRPRDLFTRHWGMAWLRLPDGGDLLVHSAHLFPGTDNAVRLQEVDEMLKVIEPDLAAGKDVILQGDLNLLPGSPEYQRLIGAGLVDAYPAAGQGSNLTIPADFPQSQLDYVLVSPSLAGRLLEFRVLDKHPFRKGVGTESFALSDHLPVLAVID